MPPAPDSPLVPWQNFYVIVGTAAGALTGLQFIVITLLTQMKAAGSPREIRAFGTPTVVHFCTALFISALMVIPWPGLLDCGGCLFAFGAVGAIYSVQVIWHARKATYSPDLGDWLWYTAFPVLGHLMLLFAALVLRWHVTRSLFLVAADSVAFLALGIHNSWDTVTYLALKHSHVSTPPANDSN